MRSDGSSACSICGVCAPQRWHCCGGPFGARGSATLGAATVLCAFHGSCNGAGSSPACKANLPFNLLLFGCLQSLLNLRHQSGFFATHIIIWRKCSQYVQSSSWRLLHNTALVVHLQQSRAEQQSMDLFHVVSSSPAKPVLTFQLLFRTQVDNHVSSPGTAASNVPGSVCGSGGCGGGSGRWVHCSTSLPPFRQQVSTALLAEIDPAAESLLCRAYLRPYHVL